jgi:hypothetical protein
LAIIRLISLNQLIKHEDRFETSHLFKCSKKSTAKWQNSSLNDLVLRPLIRTIFLQIQLLKPLNLEPPMLKDIVLSLVLRRSFW